MVDSLNSVGEFAGKIWTTLHAKGALSKNKIIEKTGLSEPEFYSAVGWLARENKISQDVDTEIYCLGTTNVSSSIGTTAGLIWQVIEMWGEVDLQSIIRLTHSNKRDVFCALGWLMREEKIEGKINHNNQDHNVFWLK